VAQSLARRAASQFAVCNDFCVGLRNNSDAGGIGLGTISPDSAVFAPYYSATLVAALVGGAAAGGTAAAAGALAAFWLFVPPDWTYHPFVVEQLVSFFLFAASSFVIIWAAKSYRDLLGRLRDEQEMRQLLNHELAHRIKNTLAIVQALITKTLCSQPDVRARLNARIAALADTHDLLIKSEWHGASLTEILAGEFAPFDVSQFNLNGDDFECPSDIAVVLALIFHELTTNASKYGALSRSGGRVDLSWTRHQSRIMFDWIESGGPRPELSPEAGFGTSLLRKSLKQFDGSVETTFEPAGLHCTFSLVLPAHLAIDFIRDKRPPDKGSMQAASSSTLAR
jgi:two-component sensor histidine kinase